MSLSKRERLRRQARGEEVDRVPTLGGWIGGARNLAALAGITIEEYLAAPLAGAVRAHLALDVDGIVGPLMPTEADQIRTGSVEEHRFAGVEPEALVEYARSLPDSERGVLAGFDARAEEQAYRAFFETTRRDWCGIEPVPNFWELGGPFPLYHQFGYTAFLSACALYPEAVAKIWWTRSVRAREKAKILAGLYEEMDLVPLLFCGEDLCNNQGPMASPQFLRRCYMPLVRMIIEPIVNAGVRVIHHCDGDVRALVGDYLAAGFSGLQGFQYELGVDVFDLDRLRGPAGERLLFFTGLSVTRTLPLGTPEQVREEIRYFYDATDSGRRMFLITSNTTGIEVPVENLRMGYAYAGSLRPRGRLFGPPRPWPVVRGRAR